MPGWPSRRGPIAPAICSLVGLALVLGPSAARPAPAAAAVEVGVYQDNPASGVPVVRAKVGKRAMRVISTYVTGGQVVAPQIVALARRNKARLLVTWLPDCGRDGARQKRYNLAAIRRGRQDAGLKRLVGQLRTLTPTPILRPMPEPNTPWYAWSGTVNGNTPAAYVEAWKRVRKVVRASGGKKIRILWAPYARSIPATAENAIPAYFPGARPGRSGRHQRLQLRRHRRPGLDRARPPLRGRVPADLGAVAQALLDRRDRLHLGRR